MALPQKRSTDRKDPTPRKLEGYHSTALRNTDPSKKYVLAYKGDPDTGVAMYEHLGFVPVVSGEGSVQLSIKKTPHGQIIEYRGHVLMEADAAELRAHWEAMQAQADERERAIVNQRGGIDPLRGIGRGVLERGELQIVNETKPLAME